MAWCPQFSLPKQAPEAVHQQENGFFRFQFLVISPTQKWWKNVRGGMLGSKKWERREGTFFMTWECTLDNWVLSASQFRFLDSWVSSYLEEQGSRLRKPEIMASGSPHTKPLEYGISKHLSSLKLLCCLWDQDRGSCPNRCPLSQWQIKIKLQGKALSSTWNQMASCTVEWPDPNQDVWTNLYNALLYSGIIPHKTKHPLSHWAARSRKKRLLHLRGWPFE